MQFIFGSTFIAEDKGIAKKISAKRGDKMGMTCLTLEGDKYDPNGTLHGGSAASQNNILSQI